jgi:hypothetical protein
MCAYPAYTVGKIDEELSLRMIDELLRRGADGKSPGATLMRTTEILAKAYKVRFVKASQPAVAPAPGTADTGGDGDDIEGWLIEHGLWSM